jgi:hypothetical protein
MSQEIYTQTVAIPLPNCGTAAAGTYFVPVLTMPGTANSGITIKKWWYATNAVIAAGSAPSVSLVEMNSACLRIASGTIGANGSAATTAGTAITGTLSTAWIPGTVAFIGVEYGQAAYGAAVPMYMTVGIQYVLGRGSA